MLHSEEFKLWIDQLIIKNKLDLEIVNKIDFISFNQYNIVNQQHDFAVYEDWWIRKPEVVKSKLCSLFNLSKRIHGRECSVIKINKDVADDFLEQNHLYGYTKSKVKYGLYENANLYAVVTFAGQRKFKNGRSVELLRYCNKTDYIVLGGLGKLLKAYVKEYKIDTIMTYIDLDWGRGEAFSKLGFEEVEIKAPMKFYVNKLSGERIPEKYFIESDYKENYIEVRNNGSIKMIKTINKSILT